MSSFLVKKSHLKGEIKIPSSKSQTLRAILFAAMAKGKSSLHHYLSSKDTYSMIEACRQFGAKIGVFDNYLEIEGLNGEIQFTEDVIHAGNSGIVLRFCSAIGALAKYPVVITGDYSIRHQRPMHTLLSALSLLQVSARSMRGDGYAPVLIEGPLRGGKVVVQGEDSQPVSALLIASAFAEEPIELVVINPGEKPWVSLTLEWLKKLDIPYINEDYFYYKMFGKSRYEGFEYHVPGDLSSAAFPIAAALITHSDLILHNINLEDSQGDKELIFIFKKMGASIDYDDKNHKLFVRKGNKLSGLKVDINNFIDAITILAVVACFAEGKTIIENAAIARQKECNRIRAITTELKKMGALIDETEEGLVIEGSTLHGAPVNSYHDHRMAMSLIVAGLGVEGDTLVHSVESIQKTYPSFYQDFRSIGATIKEVK